MRRWFAVVMITLLAFTQFAPEVAGAEQAEGWTIALYVSGDNTLSENVDLDLAEIEAAALSDGVRVVALVDQDGSGDSRLLSLEGGSFMSLGLGEVNSSWGSELDMGGGTVLREFVSWVFDEHPSGRHLLDLWGHGSGWGGVCMDRGSWLTMPETSAALLGQPVDVLTVDACQMGMVEVAYELRGAASYLVVSEKDVPSEGWPYGQWLAAIEPASDALCVCTALAEPYMAWARVNSAFSATISIVDLDIIGSAIDGFQPFARELWRSARLLRAGLSNARGATERYDGDAEYDLTHLAEALASSQVSGRLARLGRAMASSLGSAVIFSDGWTRAGDEPAEHANGLSIWFAAAGSTSSYRQLAFARDTSWDEFLDEYASAWGTTPLNIALSTSALDPDGDGVLDACQVTAISGLTGALSLELWSGERNFSEGSVFQGDSAFALFAGLPGGAYSAGAYIFAPDGRMVGFAEERDAVRLQSLLYINGTLEDVEGRPISGAEVIIELDDGRSLVATTDEWGRFSTSVPYPWGSAGRSLTVSAKDAEPLTLAPGDDREVWFGLSIGGTATWSLVLAFILLDLAMILGIDAALKRRGAAGR
jgi:hypothetical protein